MRFVLVAVSLVVAWFAWWRSEAADATDEVGGDGNTGAARRQHEARSGGADPAKPAPLLRRLRGAAAAFLDMFSGAYLYRAITNGARQRPAGHVKAA
jgi:hypothetical protein